MLRLRRTLALCFWCFVLHRAPASADEESPLRPPPPTARPGDAPPPGKTASFWSLGTPTRWIPSMSSLTPWGWSYEKKAVDESTGTPSAAQPTEPIRTTDTVDYSPEEGHSGSEDKVLAAPQTSSSTSLEKSRARWTETGTMALLVEGTSVPTDTARMSAPPSNSHSPVPGHHSVNRSSSRDDLFSLTHTHTNRSAPTPTHVLDTAPTRGSSATAQNIPKESEEEDPGPQHDPFVTSVRSTITPETTVPTAIVSTPPRAITVNPALLETTLTRHTFRSISTSTPLHSMVPTKPMEPNVSVSLGAKAPTATESQPRKTVPDPGLSEAKAGPVEERPAISTTVGIGAGSREESGPSTTQSPRANSSTPGETLDEDEEEEDRRGVLDPVQTGWDVETTRVVAITTITTTASMPLTTGNHLATDDWLSDPTDVDATFLPDCNQERSGICNSSDSWASFTVVSRATPAAAANDSSGGGGGGNRSSSPPSLLLPAPPMLVPLHSDWPSAMAAWGPAWEAHVYGLGSAFAAVTLASALNLLCLPLRCPSGCGYFGLVSLFLLAAGGTRAFSLLYDAYGHRGLVASAGASLLLYEAPFPCLTAAFGLAFLLLSMRSRMQLSYSAFQRPCVLAFLVLLHFAAAFGPAALLRLSRRGDGGGAAACLLLSLVSRGAFVALASFLSAAYFVFYCYVRADAKHIYRLNNTSPTPAERYNRCPFAESRDWERAAAAVCLAALLSLACAALQLYAVLHAAGLAGGGGGAADGAFRPWPWWAFQFSCRACEAGVCLALALVVAQPVYCADRLPQGAGSCWAELLAAKSPAAAIVGGSYQWTLGQQEKLAICGDAIGHGETECLPLYTLVDERLGSSLNGLDLLYHSNRALAYRDLDPPLLLPGSAKPEGGGGGGGGGGATSGGSSLASDSTADLRPPSPIDLRRSIDEALFSEALFPVSLFGPSGPFRCSDAFLAVPNGGPALGGTPAADPGLYRTSSCAEMAAPHAPVPVPPPSPSLSTSSSCSSPERWRGSSSSCSLCGPPSLGGGSSSLGPRLDGPSAAGGVSGHAASSSSRHQGSHLQRRYRTLGSASQESLDLDLSSEADRSVQEEFVSVCRQMDALSVCSETIDL